MRHPVAIITAAIVLIVCAAGAADTDLQAFVGTWKENPTKSRPSISGALTYTFTSEPDGFVSIVRGNTPVHDRARIDGKDYPRPGFAAGQTVSWTRVSDTLFESTIYTGRLSRSHPQRVRKKIGKELHVERTRRCYPNAVGTFSPSPAESSIGKECAANHPHFERRPGHLPATHRSSRQLSPPLFPASAPPSLST